MDLWQWVILLCFKHCISYQNLSQLSPCGHGDLCLIVRLSFRQQNSIVIWKADNEPVIPCANPDSSLCFLQGIIMMIIVEGSHQPDTTLYFQYAYQLGTSQVWFKWMSRYRCVFLTIHRNYSSFYYQTRTFKVLFSLGIFQSWFEMRR